MRSLLPSAAAWRPGAAGLAIALVAIPLILLLRGDARVFVALAALCIYPLVDVPRILGRRSWWLGAIVSVLVWAVVFTVLVQTAIAGRHSGDDISLVFIYPFLMYWIAIAVCGAMRLIGWWQGRPQDFGPKRGALVIGGTYATLVIVPATIGMIPLLVEKFTGNTPGNTTYSADGDVVSSTPDHVSVRVGDGTTQSFRFNPDTTFHFRGPGSNNVSGTAGPGWLTAGQRVGLDYVYRGGEGLASSIRVWIERKGCAGDARWTAALQATASPQDASLGLAGTIWEGTVGAQEPPARTEPTTFEFLDEYRLAYQEANGARNTNAHWRQNGAVVLVEVNDCYAEYEGRIDGETITGEFSNETGVRTTWTARRKPAPTAPSTPK